MCVSGRGLLLPPLSTVSGPHLCSSPLSASLLLRQPESRTTRNFFAAIILFVVVSRDRKEDKGVDCVCQRADSDSMPCVCVAGPQEEATLGSAGWTSPEELLEQASQAQQLERLAQLCIVSKQ